MEARCRAFSTDDQTVSFVEWSVEGQEYLFALMSDGVFVECDGIIVAVNPAGLLLYGAARAEDLIGRPSVDLVPADLVPTLAGRSERLATNSETDRWAKEAILRLDGTALDVEVRTTVIRWNKEPAALILIRPLQEWSEQERNITRFRAAALEVFSSVSLKLAQAQNHELDAVIESVLEEIAKAAEVDRAYLIRFSEDGTTLSCTHEWCGIGIERQQEYVQGLRTDDFSWSHNILKSFGRVHAPDLTKLPAEADAERRSFGIYDVRSMLSVPVVVYGEVRGSLGFNAIHRKALWPETVIRQVSAVANAIGAALTRREAAALVATARDEAELANAMKDRFLSRISHELRTPLNSVLGFTELLLLDEPNSQRRQLLAEVQSSGQHLLSLVENVLDVTRLTSTELHLALTAVPLSDVVSDAIGRVQALADERGVQLVGPAGGVEISAMADHRRLVEVLAELLSNAVLYNIRGGSVTIAVEPLVNAEHDVAITIRDTGNGMSEDQLVRLFEPFDRLGAETTSIPGVGIGLSLARMIVEKMGGVLEIDSSVGEGTTATVRI